MPVMTGRMAAENDGDMAERKSFSSIRINRKARPTMAGKECGASRTMRMPVTAPKVGENQMVQAGPCQGRSSMTQAPKARAAISGKMISLT